MITRTRTERAKSISIPGWSGERTVRTHSGGGVVGKHEDTTGSEDTTGGEDATRRTLECGAA
jgi:hypothetical protein